MAHYRLYYLDMKGRHIEDFAEFESADDQSAIQHVNNDAPHGFAELWLQGRLIEKFGQSLRHGPFATQ